MSPEILLLALRLALAIALYAFLAAVLIVLRREASRAGSAVEVAPAAHLLALNEPPPENSYALRAMNLIGRASDNTIRLDESTVSSHHARLSFQGGQWWLEDLGSKNGTGVNELDLTEPVVVTYGDQIRFGTVQLELGSGPPPSNRRPAAVRETERPPGAPGEGAE